MKILLMLTILLISNFALTKDANMKTVMKTHLLAIKSKDAKKLEQTVSKKYFKEMSKDQGLKKLFNMQTKDSKPIIFDYKIKESTYDKNLIFVNIKDKSSKHYDHYWYRIIKNKEGKYIIDGTVFFD